jgi:TonB family protein
VVYARAISGANAGPAPASNVHASAVSPPGESSPSQTKGNAPLPTNPPPTNPPALTNTAAQSNSSTNPLSVVPPVASAATAHNTQPPSNPAKGGATSSAAAQPAAQQLKKPILGNVHLATPKVTASRNSPGGGEPDADIALNNVAPPEPDAEALSTGLVGDKQPSAPATALPVGGDVKLAKLIFSVPPKYPTLAKSQHVSGNVLVDALIDASGHVTTMKVVSGPAVLHQAAMDALKQWRYVPASLDGNPVPMHLAVTIQFRLR